MTSQIKFHTCVGFAKKNHKPNTKLHTTTFKEEQPKQSKRIHSLISTQTWREKLNDHDTFRRRVLYVVNCWVMMTSQINHTCVGFSNVFAKKNHKLNTKLHTITFKEEQLKQSKRIHYWISTQTWREKLIDHNTFRRRVFYAINYWRMMTSQINHTCVGFSNVFAKKNHKPNTKLHTITFKEEQPKQSKRIHC